MKETVALTNQKQVGFYVSRGVKPIDIKYTNRLVYIFKSEDTMDVWNKWRTTSVILPHSRY